MVRQILERIARPVRELVMRPVNSLHQAAYLLAALTLASQLLALMRDRTFAHTFGAGQTLDLYYAAFRVPDLIFALIASLVSAYVLIPRITGMDREDVRRLLSESATFLVIFGGAISVVIAIFMPEFLAFLYPNFVNLPENDAFVLLSRMLLVQPILLGLSSIFGSVTQVQRRFTLFALSPVLYNLGIIFGTLVLYPYYGLSGIGAGVVIGAVAYLLVNIPVVVEVGVLPTWRWPRFSEMGMIVRDSVPRSLALGMGSITILVLTAIASRQEEGAVAVFNLASSLEAVPLALIGASYAVAAFPSLSEASALERRSEFMTILSASARHMILWSMVSLGLIAVLRAHIVRVVLGTGAFDWDATRITAALLVVLTVGLAAQGLILLFSRALYAIRQSWTPFFYQLAGAIFTVVIAIALLTMPEEGLPNAIDRLLRIGDIDGTGIILVALASTLGQIFLLVCSLIALRPSVPGLASSLIRPFIDGTLAALAGGIAAYFTLMFEGGIAPLTTLLSVFLQGFFAGLVGLAAAGLTLYVLQNEEFRIVSNSLDKLLRVRDERSSALPPSAEEPVQP